jgi:SAM-dependent methyltransferase
MGLGIKTYVVDKFAELSGKRKWFGMGYHQWQSKRIIAMLDRYGHQFFNGKTILELGAGYGDIGGFFSMLGANVTCLEGREINTDQIKVRYPAVKAMEFDLNKPLPESLSSVDLIIHFGLLYHLNNPEASLRNTCRACKYMALETECSDSSDPMFSREVREKKYHKDHAIDGIGCSPSPAFVERILKEEGMRFERIDDASCNANDHFYDWPLENTGATRKGQRRFWFVEKA